VYSAIHRLLGPLTHSSLLGLLVMVEKSVCGTALVWPGFLKSDILT